MRADRVLEVAIHVGAFAFWAAAAAVYAPFAAAELICRRFRWA
jgi:hypothetical protein